MTKKTQIDENKCDKCGESLRVGDYPFCPHGSTLPRRAQFDPIVVFKDKNGEYSFPGRSDAPTPKGYVREEITTMARYNAFRHKMDHTGREQSKAAIRAEHQYFEAIESQNRSDLCHMMRTMPPMYRDMAQMAIDTNNRQSYQTERDPGFHMDIFERDSQSYSE